MVHSRMEVLKSIRFIEYESLDVQIFKSNLHICTSAYLHINKLHINP